MKIEYPVYNDDVIAVALLAESQLAAQKNLLSVAIRYLPPKSYQKNGELVPTTNIMGGETGWFVLPHSFGTVVGKRLIEQKVSGLEGFNEEGYKRMINWLIEMEELHDAMVY